jgi:hypothetical protein
MELIQRIKSDITQGTQGSEVAGFLYIVSVVFLSITFHEIYIKKRKKVKSIFVAMLLFKLIQILLTKVAESSFNMRLSFVRIGAFVSKKYIPLLVSLSLGCSPLQMQYLHP